MKGAVIMFGMGRNKKRNGDINTPMMLALVGIGVATYAAMRNKNGNMMQTVQRTVDDLRNR